MDASSIGEEYQLIRSLGQGGTAEVFLAQNKKDRTYSALKMPLRRSAGDLATFRTLISREFDLIGGWRFPGVVRLRRLIDSPTLPFLEMEYCPGKSLESIGRIEEPQALLRLLSSISISLYYLYSAGLSHGDLKPQNIFVNGDTSSEWRNGLLFTKISDFSLAKKMGEDSGARLGVGTVGYMAPETIRGGTLEHRSDIFALGIVAYMMASGKHPFLADDSDPVRTNAAIQETEPPRLSKVRADTPESLSEIVAQMLDKLPEKRPQDGFELCRRLKAAGSDFPFERVIRPKYLMQAFDRLDNQAFLEKEFVRFSAGIRNRLYDGAGAKRHCLRSLLECNFTRGVFQWKDGALISASDASDKVIFPRRLRRAVECEIKRLSFNQKRMAMKMAVVGDIERARCLGLEPEAAEREIYTRPVLYCLRQRISAATLRRLSTSLARRAIESYKDIEMGAELYLQTGDFEGAYAAVMEAADIRIDRNENSEAVALLSALEALASNGDDETRLAPLLMKKADALKGMGELPAAEDCYKRIIALYQNKPPDRLLAETFKDLGDLYRMKQDFESGIEALRKAEEIYSALGDHLELSHTINNRGNIHCVSNRFDEALKTFRMALHIQKKLGAKKDIASTLNNIAVTYFSRGRLRRMVTILNAALLMNEECGNMVEIARVHNNLGFVHNEMGETAMAIDSLSESLKINQRIGNRRELLYNYENLIQVMIRGGRLRDALRYLAEGAALSEELNDQNHSSMFAGFVGIIQWRMGQYGKGQENLLKAITGTALLGNKLDQTLYQLALAELHGCINDHEGALKILSEAERAAESINDKRAAASILTLRAVLKQDMTLMEQAEKLAISNKVARDLQLVQLRKGHLLLESGRPDEAVSVLSGLRFLSDEKHIDIEAAGYFRDLGKGFLEIGKIAEAEGCLTQGASQAKRIGLIPETTECLIGLGRISALSGSYESAYEYYRKAIKFIKTMAESIEDENLRARYLEAGKINYLAAEIKNLNRFLGKKMGAGR
ncbi:MAG: tetratricopeptide repeat protein [Candidatus Zixiibacteriota bacterium]